jgi:hypothetical protein
MQTDKDNDEFDFQKELLELLNTSPTEHDKCLISNGNLEINHINLKCGHKFNYSALFHEIKYQKTLTNNLEIQKLSQNELKCPYCRTIQKGLLPSRENYNNVIGVNWPKKYQYKAFDCAYIFLSGNKKDTSCNKKCCDKYCIGHEKIIKTREAKAVEKTKTAGKAIKKPNVNTSTSCEYVFKKGKNKGTSCGRNGLVNIGCYCSKHKKHAPANKLSVFQISPTNVII